MAEKKDKNKTLEQKVDELTKQVSNLAHEIEHLSNSMTDFQLNTIIENANWVSRIVRTNLKHNAKLARIDKLLIASLLKFVAAIGIVNIIFLLIDIFAG